MRPCGKDPCRASYFLDNQINERKASRDQKSESPPLYLKYKLTRHGPQTTKRIILQSHFWNLQTYSHPFSRTLLSVRFTFSDSTQLFTLQCVCPSHHLVSVLQGFVGLNPAADLVHRSRATHVGNLSASSENEKY